MATSHLSTLILARPETSFVLNVDVPEAMDVINVKGNDAVVQPTFPYRVYTKWLVSSVCLVL
jgi:hypothetical protein